MPGEPRACRSDRSCIRPDVRPEDRRDEFSENVAVLRAALLPGAENEADDLGCDQLLREEREHHEAPLRFQRQPVCLRLLTRSSSDGRHHGRRVSPEVLGEMEKAAFYLDGLVEVLDSVNKCRLEVTHERDGTVEECRPLFGCELLDQAEELRVGLVVFPLDETKEHRE